MINWNIRIYKYFLTCKTKVRWCKGNEFHPSDMGPRVGMTIRRGGAGLPFPFPPPSYVPAPSPLLSNRRIPIPTLRGLNRPHPQTQMHKFEPYIWILLTTMNKKNRLGSNWAPIFPNTLVLGRTEVDDEKWR